VLSEIVEVSRMTFRLMVPQDYINECRGKGETYKYAPYFDKTVERKFFQVGTDGNIVMCRFNISWKSVLLHA
jgi:hypothetical protein